MTNSALDPTNRRKLKKTTGNPVEGERFWGREREVALFIESLKEGNHISLVAQRRIGKTSLMREVSRLLEGRCLCLWVDLQEAKSIADVVTEMSAATRQDERMWRVTKAIFTNILGRVEVDSLNLPGVKVVLRGGLAGGNWREKGDRLLAALADDERSVVIFFDEISILVNRLLKGDDFTITPERRQQVDELMSWLRANSISPRYQGKIRMVLTGSIGLEPILQQAGLSATINHFTPFELGYWSAETARGCLQALAFNYGVEFADGAIDSILDKLGVLVPYHVQMFFDVLDVHCHINGITVISVPLVDEIYRTKMLGVRGHVNLSHLEERLKMVLGMAFYPLALDLLTETAVVGSLTAAAVKILSQEVAIDLNPAGSVERVCSEILSVLEHDGYLERSADAYVFVSKLVRDWWQARYGFGFVPAAQRNSGAAS